jgi:hypothetical protein
MAVYKVPQDVEADDKLLGPFSFRQFIYLIIAVMGIAIGYGLSRLFIPLAIIPLPIIILFGALALPLRKDQPMEVYLAAVLSYYLKPRKRLWKADGIQSLVEIVAPKTVEERRTKELSEMEAEERLSYLANLVDSRGWAVRGVSVPQPENAVQADVFFEAQQTEDILDTASPLNHSLDSMIDKADAKRRQDAINLMNRPAAAAQIPPTPDPYASLSAPLPQVQQTTPTDEPATPITFNPYPEAMRQSVIHPAGSPQPMTAPQPEPTATSQPVVSPGIINLANNSDLSIETLAHEAKRIREKEEGSSDGEVVISLR